MIVALRIFALLLAVLPPLQPRCGLTSLRRVLEADLQTLNLHIPHLDGLHMFGQMGP